MSFGKLYTCATNARSTAILAVAKANGLELETVEIDTANPTPEYLELNPLSKVPTFEGSDGYVLFECMAIAIYVASQNEKTTLLGKTKQDYASILKWMSFVNTEISPKMGAWYRPLLGKDPYNKKSVEDASNATLKAISVLEKHLHSHTYLVGERITLADLFAVGIIACGFEYFFDKEWRGKFPSVTRWYSTVYNQPIYSAVAPKFSLLDTPLLTNTPPKKAEQPKKDKAPKETKEAAKPKPKPEEDEEDEIPRESKPKHPLDLLPKASLPLDEWKRTYQNNEVSVSFPFLWEKVPFEEYSLWKVKYKYESELKLLFMVNNLVGGFNNRLEASRKHLFGILAVCGQDNDAIVEGAFIIRGQEADPVFNVAPDAESYDFTKLDPTKPEDKEYVELIWACEKGITVGGKEYKLHDSRLFI